MTYDLTGQKIGLWIVLRPSAFKGKGKRPRKFWECLCACGTKKPVVSDNLLKKTSTNCGCVRNQKTIKRNNVEDLTGKKFGRWTVLSRDTNYVKNGKTKSQWLCRCDCGNTGIVLGNNLNPNRKNKSQSCGCLMRERSSEAAATNYFGRKYGLLSPLRTFKDNEGFIRWEFKCDCGSTKVLNHASVACGLTQSCGCLSKGDDSLGAWLSNSFRSPESQAFLYIFSMANHPDLSKVGIAIDLKGRIDREYGELHDCLKLPRLNAWLIEQAVLFTTNKFRRCPAALASWDGRTELRKLAPSVLFGMACDFHEKLQALGREEFAIQFLPTTPKQDEQLRAMKREAVAA